MSAAFRFRFTSAAELTRQLDEHAARGALLLPLALASATPRQFDRISLELSLGGETAELDAEVLQVLPLGLVLRLAEPHLASALLEATDGDADPPGETTPPDESSLDELDQAPAEEPAAEAATPNAEGVEPNAGHRSGPSALSLPLEKLQAEWHSLAVSERMRVAKYGKRPARGLVLRLADNTLLAVLLANPGITPEEVATVAGMGSCDNAMLRRILGNPEWLQHQAVARNLVCHPKATLQQAGKAADHLGDNDIRQLTRTGKVRAAVKRMLIKKLEQRAVRSGRR